MWTFVSSYNLQTSRNIPSRLLPCAGSCIFSVDCRCVMCLGWPRAWAGRIWSQDLDTRPQTIIMANVGHIHRGRNTVVHANDADIYLNISRYLQTDQCCIVEERRMRSVAGCGLCSGYFQKLNHSIDFNKSQLSQQPIGWNILLYCIVRYLQNIISIQTGPNERDEQRLVLTLWTANINITATIASVHSPHPGGWCRAKCD